MKVKYLLELPLQYTPGSVTIYARALIIFGKIHFLLISENESFMNEDVTEGQVFMEFM